MNQEQLTEINLGNSLDELASVDPRGYGITKILLNATRQIYKKSPSMYAADYFLSNIKSNDFVYILTGFIIKPFGKAETDGLIGSLILARACLKMFLTPIIICPSEAREAVYSISNTVFGIDVNENLNTLSGNQIGLYFFTKDSNKAEDDADYLLSKCLPSFAVTIECAGSNFKGVYHNSVGIDISGFEAKQDILFDKIKEHGIKTLSIGDLGNEIGMGKLKEYISDTVPYVGIGRCNCDCKGGSMARTSADVVLTGTCSDWAAYALIAAVSYKTNNADLMISGDVLEKVLYAGCQNGLIDMYGDHIPYIDGFSLELNKSIASAMRETVMSTINRKETCKKWFEKVNELGFF